MNLLEHEAKHVLNTFNINIPLFKVIEAQGDNFIPYPFILKSQVPTGGRGKLGGIRIIKSSTEYKTTVDELLNLEIKGYKPKELLIEELLSIQYEYYLSLLFDRETQTILLIASKHGGIEVEEGNDADFLTLPLTSAPNFDSIGQAVADWYNLAEHAFALSDLCEKLCHCFVENDATLIEINPLVLTKEKDLVAADCKIILDDAARFRHPEWSELSQQPTDANFVVLNNDGAVATIANGAGLAMATVDAVTAAGMRPANFLDIGGGANEASVLAAFEKISSYQAVKAIVINIFAGITRCDEVAKAIISARKQINTLPPLFIRLAGTNSTEANKLLDAASIRHARSLEECITSAKEVV